MARNSFYPEPVAVNRTILAFLISALAFCGLPVSAGAAPSSAEYTIVHTYPHNSRAWTEGLAFRHGEFYESTGLYGRSSLRRVDLATGTVLAKKKLSDTVFGEGMTFIDGKAFAITWKEHRALVFDPVSFDKIGRFYYSGQGSGLTTDGTYIVMSNLTSTIRFRDPTTFKTVRSLNVTENGSPVTQLNALAWVKGQIWANTWLVPDILIIDPATGNVVRRIDFSGLLAMEQSEGDPRDMNGIGYWKRYDRLFVTGKFWKHVYEIRLNT
jgi:glutamine cyclotransferase